MIKFTYSDGLKNITVELLGHNSKESVQKQFESFLNSIYVHDELRITDLPSHLETFHISGLDTMNLSDSGFDLASNSYKYDYGDYRSSDYVPPIIDVFGKPLPNDHPDYIKKKQDFANNRTDKNK